MRKCFWIKSWTLSIGLLFFLASTGILQAAKVPIHFNSYHGYTGTVKYLKQIAKAYPEITELLEIGKSNMGRPIHVLVVSNMEKGTTLDSHIHLRNMRKEGVKNVPPMKSYQGKPGHWIGGSTHGNEFTGTEVCLYIIDKLVTGYSEDPKIKQLVDTKTFYICPMINPDGVYNSVEKGTPQRSNSMKKDDDQDGRINEDGPDDLNNDGSITLFRYKNPEGRYVLDEKDPRIMIRLKPNQKTKKTRYSVIREDKDNDGDGKRGEDSEAGLDINRNFPEGWFKENGFSGGSGKYPTSSPEAHAMVEFFTNHRNIHMAQFYHTSGGFTFRPMGTAPHPKLHPKDVAVFDFVMGKKYLQIIKEEVPEPWKNPKKLDEFKKKLQETSSNKYAIMRGYELPRGWRVSYDEVKDKRYSYGMATDWAYMQYGIYSITTELWNPFKDINELSSLSEKKSRTERQRSLLKYQDENYEGKLFLPWKKHTHPELGEGEIGGWLPGYRNNAWPGKPLKNVCEKHWKFELFRAQLLPQVTIQDVQAEVLYKTDNAREAQSLVEKEKAAIQKGSSKGRFQIVKIQAAIENTGSLDTHVARGVSLANLREDVVWLVGPRDQITFLQGTPYIKLGMLEGNLKIPGYKGTPPPVTQKSSRWRRYYRRTRYYPYERPETDRPGPERVHQKGSTRQVQWVVALEGKAPLKIIVTSQKGGTRVKQISVQ